MKKTVNRKLYLYNTLTKTKETFKPINEKSVSMYVCGPTVYNHPHVGNGRSLIVFDLLYRLLIEIYGKDAVTFVRNITDVEDKIVMEAKKQNTSINNITTKFIEIFQNNAINIGCLQPNYEPKVTDHIAEIIAMIEKLIISGHAYAINGDVYFSVQKDPNYAKIAGRKLEELIAGARIDKNDNKNDHHDFVLWKKTDELEQEGVFDSPWGKGRPGWHIECSAMSTKYLGEDFDIHGGGVDLVFPHHANEIAQSCCAYEGSNYAKYWVHNGFLTVNGEKMSKSAGNFITIEDILSSGISGEIVRFYMLSNHYRKPFDWNRDGVNNARTALNSFYQAILSVEHIETIIKPELFIDALLDDLNTPKAYSILYSYLADFNKSSGDDKDVAALKIKESFRILGLLDDGAKSWFDNKDIIVAKEEVEKLIESRKIAKQNKDFILADKIRDELHAKKIIIKDNKDGSTSWYNA